MDESEKKIQTAINILNDMSKEMEDFVRNNRNSFTSKEVNFFLKQNEYVKLIFMALTGKL